MMDIKQRVAIIMAGCKCRPNPDHRSDCLWRHLERIYSLESCIQYLNQDVYDGMLRMRDQDAAHGKICEEWQAIGEELGVINTEQKTKPGAGL